MSLDHKYRVLVTAMIFDSSGKILLTRRKSTKERWAGKWTFPGGHLNDIDFLPEPTEINNQWYHALENALRREVNEEVGIEISDINYLCNIVIPDAVIISFTAKCKEDNPNISLSLFECDAYTWVTPKEAESYDLIDGLLKEIKLACSN